VPRARGTRHQNPLRGFRKQPRVSESAGATPVATTENCILLSPAAEERGKGGASLQALNWMPANAVTTGYARLLRAHLFSAFGFCLVVALGSHWGRIGVALRWL
jgi:hypothetical protein